MRDSATPSRLARLALASPCRVYQLPERCQARCSERSLRRAWHTPHLTGRGGWVSIGLLSIPPGLYPQEPIFGLNAARVFGVDVHATRNAIPQDYLSRIKMAYLDEGPPPAIAGMAGLRASHTDCAETCAVPGKRV
jgi:hypothetical protein